MLTKIVLFLIYLNINHAENIHKTTEITSRNNLTDNEMSCEVKSDSFNRIGYCDKYCAPGRELNEFYSIPFYFCYHKVVDNVTDCSYCCADPTSGKVQWKKENGVKRIERISEKKCWEQHYTPLHPTALYLGVFSLPEEFPHMTIIGWRRSDGKYDFKCAGSLIAPNFVLCSANCLDSKIQKPSVVIVGGTSLNNASAPLLPIIEIFQHPKYTRELAYNDIALLKLGENSSNPIACLWQTDAIYHAEVTAIGYGIADDDKNRSKDLIKGNLSVLSNDHCNKFYASNKRYKDGIVDSQICIGDPDDNKEICKGDSGGPIELKTFRSLNEVPWVLGITSFDKACAAESPSIYTRVFSFLDWIEPIVWPNL